MDRWTGEIKGDGREIEDVMKRLELGKENSKEKRREKKDSCVEQERIKGGMRARGRLSFILTSRIWKLFMRRIGRGGFWTDIFLSSYLGR